MPETTTPATVREAVGRIYRIDITPKNGGPTVTRLVRARSGVSAEQHVSDDIIAVRIATADDAYELASAGIKVESAGGFKTAGDEDKPAGEPA